MNCQLKKLRKQRKITQENIAKTLGIKRATYSAYECGKISPPYEKLKKLSDFYNVTVEDLMGEQANVKENAIDIPELLRELRSGHPVKINDYYIDDSAREILIATLELFLLQTKTLTKNYYAYRYEKN